MREYIQNVLYGVLDYIAYPLAMLLVAPLLMRTLGVEGYGLWSIMAAAVSAASIVASGFGDAGIKHVSQSRTSDPAAVVNTVTSLFLLSGILAVLFALPFAAFSPWIAERIARGNVVLRVDCIASLLMVAVLILQRAVESVFISTQRAFERYGAAVRISIVARVASMAAGTVTAAFFHRVWIVLLITALCNIVATILQCRSVRVLLHVKSLRPHWHTAAITQLFQFGKYSWLLALSGVIFGQMDRLVLGMWLGASSTASYAICAQIAQPIYGIASAGLHVLFPYLSHRAVDGSHATFNRAITIAALGNLIFVVIAALSLQIIGWRFLATLGRSGLNGDSGHLLVTLLWSTALLATSVVPTYALYALDRVHLVTAFNVLGAILCVVCMVVLGKRFGAEGIAFARLAYGLSGLLLYLPLIAALKNRRSSVSFQCVLGEEA